MIIVIKNPTLINITINACYFLINMLINLPLYYFVSSLSSTGNFKPNLYINLFASAIISRVSYKLALKSYQSRFNLQKDQLANYPSEGIKAIREEAIFLTNISYAVVLNFLYILSYYLINLIVSKV